MLNYDARFLFPLAFLFRLRLGEGLCAGFGSGYVACGWRVVVLFSEDEFERMEKKGTHFAKYNTSLLVDLRLVVIVYLEPAEEDLVLVRRQRALR